MYKPSAYNIVVRNNEKAYILNTLYGTFVKFIDNDACNALSYLKKDLLNKNDCSVFHFLRDKSFIIPSELNEDSCLVNLQNKIVGGNHLLNLIILPTESCNFRCSYCYESFNPITMDDKTINNILSFVEKEIIHYKAVNINWFGGEPLLSLASMKKISLGVLKICREYHKPFTAGITTNGYYLNSNMVKELKNLKVIRFGITLDGLSEHHNNQRMLANGNGSWEQVVDNLRDIRDNCSTSLCTFTIRTNLTKSLHKDFPRFIDYIKKEFGCDKRFIFLLRIASDWGGDISPVIKNNFCTEEEYVCDLLYALENGIYINILKDAITPGGLLCYAWKKGTYIIKPDGNIAFCTLRIEDIVGNIENESNFKKLQFNARSTPTKCIKCIKYPICLKQDCNLSNLSTPYCDYDIKHIEKIIPYIATENYGCINYTK